MARIHDFGVLASTRLVTHQVAAGLRFLAFLCVIPVLVYAQASVRQGPADRLRALVKADFETPSDSSVEAWSRFAERDRATLASLQTVPRSSLGGDDRLLYDMFEWVLNQRLDEFRCRLYLTPYWTDPRSESVLYLSQVFLREAAPRTVAEWKERVKRLEPLPSYVDGRIPLIREAIKARMLPSRPSVPRAELGLVPAGTPSAAQGLAQYLRVPADAGPERAKLQEQADDLVRKKIAPALNRFRDVIEKEYLPACPEFSSLSTWPNGAEIYRVLARRYTTLDVDPKELHARELQEVVRIRSEMAALLPKMGYDGTLDEFLAASRTDKRFYFETGSELLAAYTEAVRRVEPLVPKIIHWLPKAALRVEANGGLAVASAYAPGVGVVMVDISKPEIRPKFEIMTLMLHEGVPGHHIQLSLARQARAGRPELARFQNFVAFSEGWAAYAETLGDDLGVYSDPYDRFGHLTWMLLRAIRVVVDTGMHVYGWSLAKAREYFVAQTGKPEAVADSEVLRSLNPAGQLGYKIGQERFTAMRQQTEKALGRDFELGNFHDALLSWGPLPMTVLERKLDECLAESDCRATLRAAR